MNFVAENALEQALVASAANQMQRPEFYRQLFEAPVFVLGDLVPLPMSREKEMRLVAARNGSHDFHLVFSSLARLRKFSGPNDPFIAIAGRDLFAAVPGASFYLNPGIEYGRELPPDEVARMLDALPAAEKPRTGAAIKHDQPTEVTVYQPSENPKALVDALIAAFAARGDIDAAHLALVAFASENEPPHFMVGVETLGDWDAIAAEIGQVAAGLMPGQLFDVARIDRSRPDDGLSQGLLSVPAFYTRAGAVQP
jgi:hypothetical protein